MRKIQMFIFIALTIGCYAQNKSVIREYKKVFTTYPYSDPNPVPAPHSSIYPYFSFSGYTAIPQQKEWKVVELENDYIKVLIFPEQGGKVWTAIEKSTGHPFIYYNHVVKFRNIASRGPWASGGIEFNFGTYGHASSTVTPVDYTTRANEDGSVSCFLGTLDLATRTDWRVEINLPKDKAFFTTNTFWYGNSSLEEGYYQWNNAAFPSAGNLEFLFPGTGYIGHDGEYGDYPVNKTNGKKISFYEENDFGPYKSYHIIGKHTDFYGAYWHDNDFGTIHYSPRDEKAGMKIWIWGLSGQGMIWEKLLTNTDGQYVELQSGRLFNQNTPESSYTPFKHRGFFPYSTDVWTEYWYPISKTDGAVEANQFGALNLKYNDGWLKLWFCPVQKINYDLQIYKGDQAVYTKKLELNPLQLYTDSIRTDKPGADWKIVLGDQKLVYSFDPEADVLKRPHESPADFNWNGEYGLTLEAKELIDQRQYEQAWSKLQEALKINPNYVPALVKITLVELRSMKYNEALEHATKALSIDALAGDVNYYYGLANTKAGRLVDAKDGFEIASLSYEYRSAAYIQLGLICMRENNPEKAIEYAQKALDFNRYSISALKLAATAYRQMNNNTKARGILDVINALDPLCHFVNFEKYLWEPTDKNKSYFLEQIRTELPHESIEELGIWYYNAGCNGDAEKLFACIPDFPVAAFWLSFLRHEALDFSKLNPAFSFPFRDETKIIIEHLLTWQNHWMLKYHLALILANKNHNEESKQLIFECDNESDFAPFYAYRATMQSDSELRLADIKKAISLDPGWRYQKMLVEYYSSNPGKAIAMAKEFLKKNPTQSDFAMMYMRLLMQNKNYPELDNFFATTSFIPMEASTEARDLFREVKLMRAFEFMNAKNYKKALKYIDEAKLYPENLGSGKPYPEFIDERVEDYMSYLCYTKLNNIRDANNLLDKIIKYYPPKASFVDNYSPANELITAWVYDLKNDHGKALDWLNNVNRNKEKVFKVYQTIQEGKAYDFTGLTGNTRLIEKLIDCKK